MNFRERERLCSFISVILRPELTMTSKSDHISLVQCLSTQVAHWLIVTVLQPLNVGLDHTLHHVDEMDS